MPEASAQDVRLYVDNSEGDDCPLWGLSDAVKIHRARNPAESVGKCRHGDETYKGRQSTATSRLSGQEVGASS